MSIANARKPIMTKRQMAKVTTTKPHSCVCRFIDFIVSACLLLETQRESDLLYPCARHMPSCRSRGDLRCFVESCRHLNLPQTTLACGWVCRQWIDSAIKIGAQTMLSTTD